MRGAWLVQWRSIRFGLTRVFVLFLALVLLLGLFAVQELGAVNQVSAEVRDRWLQSTRVLGDLNNYTSDARAAEASRLLAQTAAQRAAVDRQIAALDSQVDQADRAYRQIVHDDEERRLYQRFWAAWRGYRSAAGQVLALARAEPPGQAAAGYMTQSLPAYNRASDALGMLTSRTVARAGLANTQAMATYHTARALILVLILIAGVIVVVAVNYISRHITDPILGLAARMRSLAANDVHFDIAGEDRRDEIGEMARAVAVFRSNAVELAHSQRGLVQQASMLAERLEAEQALTTLQRNFVSMASHEFRTPLTIIDGHAQRLISMQSRLTPDDIAGRAGRIRKTVRQMSVLIDQLLNSSRILDGQSSGLYFHPTDVDLGALLQDVCNLHREISPDAHIAERLAPSPLIVTGDYNLLYQAFSNILSNAIKYTVDGGTIVVRSRRETDTIVIDIKDAGIGIPGADLQKVFERYHRGRNTGGIVGAGVGLYLVKIVVELHRGAVAVESVEGEGSQFTVRLPSRAAP
jgi:signal transduction histidine kinase